MFTTLCAENRALPLLRDLGCSNAFLARLVSIEESKLSRALRLLKPLSNEEGLRLLNTLVRLTELRDAVRPLALDLKNPEQARVTIRAFEGMDAAQVRERVSALFAK